LLLSPYLNIIVQYLFSFFRYNITFFLYYSNIKAILLESKIFEFLLYLQCTDISINTFKAYYFEF
jgi:hypothetical protein